MTYDKTSKIFTTDTIKSTAFETTDIQKFNNIDDHSLKLFCEMIQNNNVKFVACKEAEELTTMK